MEKDFSQTMCVMSEGLLDFFPADIIIENSVKIENEISKITHEKYIKIGNIDTRKDYQHKIQFYGETQNMIESWNWHTSEIQHFLNTFFPKCYVSVPNADDGPSLDVYVIIDCLSML